MKNAIAIVLTSTALLSGCIAHLPPIYADQAIVQHSTVVQMPSQRTSNAVHVCTLKPFTTEYRSENTHRGQAKLAVQKQCLNEVHAMFCEEKDIVCRTYE